MGQRGARLHGRAQTVADELFEHDEPQATDRDDAEHGGDHLFDVEDAPEDGRHDDALLDVLHPNRPEHRARRGVTGSIFDNDALHDDAGDQAWLDDLFGPEPDQDGPALGDEDDQHPRSIEPHEHVEAGQPDPSSEHDITEDPFDEDAETDDFADLRELAASDELIAGVRHRHAAANPSRPRHEATDDQGPGRHERDDSRLDHPADEAGTDESSPEADRVTETLSPFAQAQQEAQELLSQLASQDDPDEPVVSPARGASMERLRFTGHDIRMLEFKRSIRGGYRCADVDETLRKIGLEFDRLTEFVADAEARLVAVEHVDEPDHSATPLATEPHTDSAYLLLEQARRVADDTIRATQLRADKIVEAAEKSAKNLHLKAREAGEATLTDARRDAAEKLAKAREETEQLLREARDREVRAARLEAEAELKLAHAEQLLADKAEALGAEARRLDELASWLANPETPTDALQPVIDETGEVIEFRRTAD